MPPNLQHPVDPAYVTEADPAASAHAEHLATHLVILAELLADDGPLAYLRFQPEAMEQALRQGPALSPQSAQDARMDAVFAACISALATPQFVRQFRASLSQLADLDYVPQAHRDAARTAVAMTPATGITPALQGADAPALYVLFCVQAEAHFRDSSADRAAACPRP